MNKLVLILLTALVMGCSESNSTVTRKEPGIALSQHGDSITLINPETRKPLEFTECDKRKNPCKIFTEEFRTIELKTIVFSEKKSGSVDCCVTELSTGGNSQYCQHFTDQTLRALGVPTNQCPPGFWLR